MHRIRLARYGDSRVNLKSRSPEARFWEKVDRTGDCWVWTGARFTEGAGGYAQFWLDGSTTKAHIWAYKSFVGPIPHGMQIDHECRNRLCVNPRHLRLATNKQNQENRAANHKNPTGIRGVRKLPSGRYHARVRHNGTEHTVGTFDSPLEAEAAVIAKRNELFTHNASDRVT